MSELPRHVVQAFTSKSWRMSNLYKVRDMHGKIVKFVRNSSQETLAKVKHPRVIVTKARQLGISTDAVLDALDSCLFNAGTQAGIQSYGLVESAKLKAKAQLAWELIPKQVKNMLGIVLVSDNANGMSFSNGSVLRIGNFRGDTLTRFHVSELALIAKDNPIKANQIKTGAFEAVAMGNKISIESTADGSIGLHAEIWEDSVAKLERGEELTPLDFYPVFLGFLDVDKYNMEYYVEPMERAIKWFNTLINDYKCKINVVCCGNTLIDNPLCPSCGTKSPYVAEEEPTTPKHVLDFTIPKLNWTINKIHNLGEAFNSEYPVIADIAFHTPVEGSYFVYEYEEILKTERLKSNLYNPDLPVHVAWDLGMRDEMVILLCQVGEDKIPRIINEHHEKERGLPYFVTILNRLHQEFGYKYGNMYIPFDVHVIEMSVEKTRETVLRDLGVHNISPIEKLPFADSIQMARLMLAVCEIDKDRAGTTINTLQRYRKKYDKKLGIFLAEDVHDIYSNYASALRYLAQGLGYAIKVPYKKSEKLYEEEYEDIHFEPVGLAL